MLLVNLEILGGQPITDIVAVSYHMVYVHLFKNSFCFVLF